MHSLNQIHSLNEQAVIDEFNRKCQRIIADGGSYITRKDPVTGKADHTSPIDSFPTAATLKANVLASIPAHSINNYVIVYGRN